MRIRYIVPFRRKIIIDDHWPIPMQGGRLQIIEESGYAKAIELIFEKQPLEYAPRVQVHSEDEVVATITGRDNRMIFVKRQLDEAATFLECIHDIDLITEEIEAKYEGEADIHRQQILRPDQEPHHQADDITHDSSFQLTR